MRHKIVATGFTSFRKGGKATRKKTAAISTITREMRELLHSIYVGFSRERMSWLQFDDAFSPFGCTMDVGAKDRFLISDMVQNVPKQTTRIVERAVTK